ncbi:MAG: hypothetical protein JJ714_03220 [Acidithiobacillus sp.]|nr:hypothetical protein [Acidithiobacillus sp.]
MLAIVSGVPGSGKTLWVVDQILNNPEFSSRPVYVHGIEDFNFNARSGLFRLDDPTKWEDCPQGSVIVFDEAQFPFPVRPASKAPPSYIDNFSTHRHKGFDIFMTTQHPTMLDAHIRKNCGRHLHFLRVFGLKSCTIFEWPEYRTDNDSAARRKLALVKRWSYPKSVFGAYKSADVHTHTRKIPRKVLMIPVFLVVGALIFFFWFRFMTDGSFASLGTVHHIQSPTSSNIQSQLASSSPSVPLPSSLSPAPVAPSPVAFSLSSYRFSGRISSAGRSAFVFSSSDGRFLVVSSRHCSPVRGVVVCTLHGVSLPVL